MKLKLTVFQGEFPRVPDDKLPDNAAADAVNADFTGGELRGIKGAATVTSLPIIDPLEVGLPTYNSKPVVSIWTENGRDFYGWPFRTSVVKSPIIGEVQPRIFYTTHLPAGLPNNVQPGPLIKSARLKRDNGAQVINGLVPNYYPPEENDINEENDAWVLGVPAPKVQDMSEADVLTVTMVDKTAWPEIPRLRLRVTFFWEAPNGQVLRSVDISNIDNPINGEGTIGPANVYNSTNHTLSDPLQNTGNKIQDLWWNLNDRQSPYKLYWFNPPELGDHALARTVDITATAGPMSVEYSGGTGQPPPPSSGGTEGLDTDFYTSAGP